MAINMRARIQAFVGQLTQSWSAQTAAPTDKAEPAEQSNETLKLENIHLKQPSMDRDAAIRRVGEKLHQAGFIDKPYIDAMLEREKQVSTYLDNGVAIPHGTNEVKDKVRQTGLVVCQFPDGVKYGREGEVAHILIGIAAKGDEHLSVLAALANQIGNPQIMKLLATTDKPTLIYKVLAGEMMGG